MFDLAWSEIALIAVVALVVIGPKDLPGAIRGIADGIKKMRKMAGEFQQQADELVKEAKLDELRNQIQDVRSTISDIRNFDIKSQIEKHIDKDGTIREGLSDPMAPSWKTPAADPASPPASPPGEAPDFVPPAVANAYTPPPPPPPPVEAPAFVPPSYAPPPPPAPVVSAPPQPAPAMIPPTSPEPARSAGSAA